MNGETMDQMIQQCSAMMESMQEMMAGAGGMMTGAPGSGMGSMPGMGATLSGPYAVAWIVGAVVIGTALIVGALLFIRRRAGRGSAGASANDELDRRYALGELERDRYFEMRKDLETAHN